MPAVEAVRVWPAAAVPLMVGSPVAGVVGGLGDLEDLREPVHRAGVGGCPDGVAAEGAVAATGGVGPADLCTTDRGEPLRDGAVEGLGAVVCAAGERAVDVQGNIEPVGAGLVLVVDLIVPVPVVEVLVFVGYLGAVQPVDGYALVFRGERGGGVVAGVDVGGAANYSETCAVGPYGGVAGRGTVLDEGVVGCDVGGRGVALGGREEYQPELVARVQGSRLEAPVCGDLGGGRWCCWSLPGR